MTDKSDSTPGSDAPSSDWQTLNAAHAQFEAELFKLNKATLFDALVSTGVTQIVVTFDGYGDSGQIEGVEVKDGDKDIDMPGIMIEFAEAIWGVPEPRRSSVNIATAIESLAYDVLGMTHNGWADGDGAYGSVIFNVAEGLIRLDYDERYIATENYVHIF